MLVRADENIALNKAAYASSTYDYNLTAQLVTDGLESGEPAWLKVSMLKANFLGARRNGRWMAGAIFKKHIGRVQHLS